MTRLERQLTAVLGQVAVGVRDETLPPLTAPDQPARRWMSWYAPLAAAAAVVLVAGVAVVASRNFGTASNASNASSATGVRGLQQAPSWATSSAGPPRYYADVENEGTILIRATATGDVTATKTACASGEAAAVAAMSDATFYIACSSGIFTFNLTESGKIVYFTQVPGGELPIAPTVLAVSPDGAEIAISGTISRPFGETPAPEIIVIDARTGVRSIWRNGLNRVGAQLSIASLSWTSDGQSLVFLADWCSPQAETLDSCVGTRNGLGPYDAQVRALHPGGSSGGRLDSGPVLLGESARFPYIAQALTSGDGSELIVAVMSGKEDPNDLVPGDLTIVTVSVASGRQTGVLLSKNVGEPVTMGADESGEYLLVAAGGGGSHGWLHDGVFHPIPPYNGDGQQMAW
jgi:hypothetical protein